MSTLAKMLIEDDDHDRDEDVDMMTTLDDDVGMSTLVGTQITGANENNVIPICGGPPCVDDGLEGEPACLTENVYRRAVHRRVPGLSQCHTSPRRDGSLPLCRYGIARWPHGPCPRDRPVVA